AEVSWLGANVMGPDQLYGRCASWREIGIRIDAGVRENGWPGRRLSTSKPSSIHRYYSRIDHQSRWCVALQCKKGSRGPTFMHSFFVEWKFACAQHCTPPAHRRCAFFSALSLYNERASRRGC